jgi:hypothetical protein
MMTWKLLSWAIRQTFGTAKGNSILAALQNNPAVEQVVAIGDKLIADAEAKVVTKAGL